MNNAPVNDKTTVNLVVGGIITIVLIMVVSSAMLAAYGKTVPDKFADLSLVGLTALATILTSTRVQSQPQAQQQPVDVNVSNSKSDPVHVEGEITQ